MGKRKHSDPREYTARKIRKLERKLEKARRKHRRLSTSDTDSSAGARQLEQHNIVTPHNDSELELESLEEPYHENNVPATGDSTQVEVAAELTAEVTGEVELDPSILSLLGEEPTKQESFSAAIHKDIASRWTDILVNGLKDETKKNLLTNYDIPKNLKLALPPLLNPEIKAAVNDNIIKRDGYLQEKQKYLACGITCIAEIMTLVLTSDAKNSSDNKKILQSLSDAGRLLCNIHFSESCSRRNFLLASLSKGVKDNIKDLKRDHYLFGSDLNEKLKSMKAITRTGFELRPTQGKPRPQPKSKQPEPSTSRPLNWRGPPPPAPRGGFPRPSSTAGGRKQPAARPREAARRDTKQRGRPARR